METTISLTLHRAINELDVILLKQTLSLSNCKDIHAFFFVCPNNIYTLQLPDAGQNITIPNILIKQTANEITFLYICIMKALAIIW